MDIIESFKARVKAALDEYEVAPSTFGHDAIGDPSFVSDLLAGREPKMSTIAKVDAHIAKLRKARAA